MEILFTVVLMLGLGALAMTLFTPNQGTLERNVEIADPSVFDLIQELQGLKFEVLAGAATDTNIAVAGIAVDDTILKCMMVEPDDGTTSTMLTDVTSETNITSAGNIQLDTTTTTGKQLLLIYYDKIP